MKRGYLHAQLYNDKNNKPPSLLIRAQAIIMMYCVMIVLANVRRGLELHNIDIKSKYIVKMNIACCIVY